MTDQVSILTQSIIRVVKENCEYQSLTLRKVKSLVQESTGINNPGRVGTIVKSLIEAGVLDGSVSGRTIRYITVGSNSNVQSQTNDREVLELKQNNQILNDTVNGLKDLIVRHKRQFESEYKKLKESQPENVERVVEVQLKQGKKVVKKIKDVFHKEFGRLLDLAKARKNIFIYGPTGCGKSHVCKQLADSLGLRFAFVSCTVGMSEGVLAGRLLPVGDGGSFSYVISEFIDCYENGGLFLLDEIDAADPNVLLLVNAALANGKVAVPNRPEKPYAERHKDFVCVAAANTAGTNADRLYSGRNKLDGATLDRFQIGKVVFYYDKEVEEQLCPDKELLEKCWTIRKAINENRLERAMSTRFIVDAYEMKHEFKWDDDKIFAAFFSGWREDEKNKVTSFI